MAEKKLIRSIRPRNLVDDTNLIVRCAAQLQQNNTSIKLYSADWRLVAILKGISDANDRLIYAEGFEMPVVDETQIRNLINKIRTGVDVILMLPEGQPNIFVQSTNGEVEDNSADQLPKLSELDTSNLLNEVNKGDIIIADESGTPYARVRQFNRTDDNLPTIPMNQFKSDAFRSKLQANGKVVLYQNKKKLVVIELLTQST